MIAYWDHLLRPYIERARPASVLLAGGGEDDALARAILAALKPWDGTLHLADRTLRWDPGALRREAGDGLIVHRADAAVVMGLLASPDLLLLNGDPNWHTAHAALSASVAQARRTGRNVPVTLLADTGWPYGRRDGYDDPAIIPPHALRPHERAGLHPHAAAPVPGGMFPNRYNAVDAFEPGSGVLTAAEAFLADAPGRFGAASLPFQHGITAIYPLKASGQAAVGWLIEAMRMGEAARAAGEAAELARAAGLAEAAGSDAALKAARHHNAALLEALRAAQIEAAGRGSVQVRPPAAAIPPAGIKASLRALRSAVGRRVRGVPQEFGAEPDAGDIARLGATPILNAAWYLARYPDVAASGADPAAHYLRSGAAEGRDPGPEFSTRHYAAQNPDVVQAGLNPVLHYLAGGAREGRDPSPVFASAYYLEAYPDVAAAGLNPLEHYIVSGRGEGRRPMRPL